MLRLLVNDFRLNAVFVFWVFFLFNVNLVLTAWLGMTGRDVAGGIQSGIVFASAIAVAVFLREEQNKGQIIIRSLPISHSKIVCARYLSIFFLVIAGTLYGVSYWLIIAPSIQNTYHHFHFLRLLTNHLGDSFVGMQNCLTALALAVTATVAIAVPLIVRYGTFWRILIGYLVVMVGWSIYIPSLLRWTVFASRAFGSIGLVFLVAALIIAIMVASIRLSTWLYARKDL